MARVEPCLSRNCTRVALAANAPREIGQRAAAGNRGVDQRIETKIDVHQFTFARRDERRAIEAVQRVDDRDGEAARPCGSCAGNSPATPMIDQAPETAARNASCSTARQAASERRAGTAHRGHLRHQRMAIGDRRNALAIGDEVGLAGQRHDGADGRGR